VLSPYHDEAHWRAFGLEEGSRHITCHSQQTTSGYCGSVTHACIDESENALLARTRSLGLLDQTCNVRIGSWIIWDTFSMLVPMVPR
jgi:hypothetical protein